MVVGIQILALILLYVGQTVPTVYNKDSSRVLIDLVYVPIIISRFGIEAVVSIIIIFDDALVLFGHIREVLIINVDLCVWLIHW